MEAQVRFDAPASVAPGVLRFASSATAPERGVTRVAPLGALVASNIYQRAVALPPLGSVDREEVKRLKMAAASALAKGRLLIGLARNFTQEVAVNPTATTPEDWTLLPDGSRIWRTEVSSVDAIGLRVHVEGISLPAGAQLLAYSPGQPMPGTPITAASLNGEQEAWTETILGDKVVVECQLQAEADPTKVMFSIRGVSHLFQLPGVVPNVACENDVTCYPSWANVANGVARIGFVENGNSYLCSGCLLNTVPVTYTPYFLTANHCVLNQTVASTLELWWFYQTSSCNGAPPSLAQVPHTSGGADFLAGFGPSDFTFLRLRQAPPAGAQYLGWSVRVPSAGAGVSVVHHPGGNPKKISLGTLANSESFFWDIQWNSGVTEQGSSGSPLFNSDLQVIGQLYGGLSACANPSGIDQFGRFDVSYPHIAQWLAPAATKIIGLSGDLGFGSVQAMQTATRTLLINNSGDGPINVSGINCPSGFSGSWSGTIPAGSSHGVTVSFTPAGQFAYGGTLSVNSDANSGVNTIPVSGTGYWPLTHAWNIWWQDGSGNLGRWSMVGPNMVAGGSVQPSDPGLGWYVKGVADLNSDGQTDLIFERSSGAVAVWFMNGFNQQSAAYLSPSFVDPQWQIAGTGDFNHDGKKDIIWQYSDGSIAVWLMNGRTASAVRFTPGQVDPSWHLVGAADFNGDSQTDLLWQHDGGWLAVWFMNGTTQMRSVYLTPSQVDPSWKIAGVYDFNGDGHPGLLWRQDSGALAYWQMAGTVQVHSGRLNPGYADPFFQIVGPK
jgi:hypothetical protein